MNIYLACTVRGDRGAIAALRAVAQFLEERGHCVLTRHLLADDVEGDESALTERDVFERDMQWLGAADVVIAEASGSSYCVGFEVGYAIGQADRTGQRVLLLYAAARRGQVSRLIAGNAHPSCRTVAYHDTDDLLRIVDAFMANATGSAAAALRVRIHRLSASVSLPRYESAQAAAFDLAASDDVLIEPGRVSLVPTGLVIEVPAGRFLGIFARSSTPLKRGLMVANGVGVVDPDYCGPRDEIKIAVLNFSPQPVQVRTGDRLAQGIVLPAPRVTWEEVAEIRPEIRGGFGSTG
jgi:dUTP pyrophosphatase